MWPFAINLETAVEADSCKHLLLKPSLLSPLCAIIRLPLLYFTPSTGFPVKFWVMARKFITDIQGATVLITETSPFVRWDSSATNPSHFQSMKQSTVSLQNVPAAPLQAGRAVYSFHYHTFPLHGSCCMLLEVFPLQLPRLSEMCLLGSALTPVGFDCAPHWIISELLEFIQGTPQRAEPAPPNITAQPLQQQWY